MKPPRVTPAPGEIADVSEPTLDRERTVAEANGSHWMSEMQAWRLRPGRSRRRLVLFGVAGLVLLAAIAYGVHWWHWSSTHVSTDDAFIAGHIAPVSARVGGTVAEVLVNDNQEVKAGDVLVRLDSADYDVALALARAAAEAARGELQSATANLPLTDESTRSLLQEADASLAAVGHAQEGTEHDLEQKRSDLSAKQAAVDAARAAHQAAQADFERAKLDRDRANTLYQKELVARQDLDHAEATFKNASAMLDMAGHRIRQAEDDARLAAAAVQAQAAAVAGARQRVGQSRAQVANARTQRQQVKLREADLATARGKLQLALANVKQAQLNLDYATIRAPIAGRVTRKAVEIGQVVPPGQPLLAVVDLDDVWVLANFKETQLTGIKPGQRATVEVDTHPGVVYKARVDSVQGGSGAVFSLLPPENASGNYVKIVQRIPVKLVLERGENAQHLLVPGMSVVPTIDLR
jgi:membrane fusion protein, multidrug efflux system